MSYTPKTWIDGEVIYHQDLNRMEQGIQTALLAEAKVLFVETNPTTGFPNITNPVSSVIYACLKLPQEQTDVNSLYKFFTYKGTAWQNISQGQKGDGNFTFIKYSESQPVSDSDIHDVFSSSTDRYIGFYNGTSNVAPSDYTEYTWCRFIGTSPVVTIEQIQGGNRVTITDEINPNGQSFIILNGINAVNPFKGWFTTDNIPTTGQEGDYCNVTDTQTQTVTIYRWNTTQNEFIDTGEVPDTATGETFASGETLQGVAIDNSHLVNPINIADATQPVLARVEDVMQLKAKLGEVTASEVKATPIIIDDSKFENGAISSSTGEQIAKINCTGMKKVRFYGLFVGSSSGSKNIGFAFYSSGETLDETTLITYYNIDSTRTSGSYYKEYVVDVPANAVTFVTQYKRNSFPTLMTGFYCYLQSGDSVSEMIEGIVGKEENYDESLGAIGNWQVCIGNSSTQMEEAAIEYSSYDNTIQRNISKYKGKKLTIVGNSSWNTYYMFLKKNIDLPQSGSPYTLQYLVENDYLSSYHNVDNTWKASFQVSTVNPSVIIIPDDAEYLMVSKVIIQDKSHTRLPKSISVQLTRHIDGTIDEIVKTIPDIVEQQVEPMISALEDSVSEIDKTVYGEDVEVIDDLQVETLVTEKISLDKTQIYNFGKNNRAHRAYVIPVKGWRSVTITPGERSTYLGIFKKKIPVGTFSSSTIQSEYVATGCEGYIKQSGSVYMMIIYPTGSESSPNGETTIILSDNAEYLYVQKNYSDTTYNYTPSSIVLQKTEKQGGLVDKEYDSGGISGLSKTLTIDYGNLDENGKVVEDDAHLITGFIPMVDGFYLELQDDCYVEAGMLYDTQGNLLNKDYFKKKLNFTNMFGSGKMLPQFLIRLVIGGNITSTDIVKKYFTISDSRFVRTIPTGLKFKETLYRLAQLENAVWRNDYRVKYNTSTYFEPATWIGVPYSEAGEYTKYLGIHVSLRTFLTAVLNKRSVLYTEMINGNANESKYGLSYHGLNDLSSTYYGTVCSGLTSYVDGSKNVKFSGSQEGTMYARGHRDETTGLTTIEIKENNEWREATIDELFNLIEPLDFGWNTGHITIISDVYKDAFGDKQFFVWSEQTTPVGFSTPFTKESLLNRLNYTVNTHPSGSSEWKEWAFYRKTTWFAEHPDMPQENSSEYIQDNFFTYPESLSIDNDITTFAGEYAAFSINSDNDDTDTYNNNKAFLNIHRNGGVYDRLQIFNESDDESIAIPITVDISSNSGTFIYNSDSIYTNDASDKEDWIIVDLTQLPTPLTHGKYKARVINSSDSEIVSGFTHFQMVDISFTCEKTTNPDGIATTFNSWEGVPYLIRQEKPDGMSINVSEFTNSDVESGEKTLSWSNFSTYNYVKLFVRADYGVVVKRIDMSV